MEDREEFLQEAQDDLAELLKPFQQDLNRRQRLAKFVQQCLHCVEREDFIQLDELLKSKAAEDVEAERKLKAGKEIFARLRRYADEQVERYRIEFIEDLQARATEAELPLKVDFPHFTALKGIDGKVDFAARHTVINKKTLKSIDPRRIIAAVRRVKAQLYDRPYDPQTFIDGLYKIYNEVLKEGKKKPGDAVPIQRFYFAYVISLQNKSFFQNMDKGRFKGYSADQFAVDIWRYFQAGIGGTSDGHALQLRSGRNNALWLIDSAGERGQMTGISFQEAER